MIIRRKSSDKLYSRNTWLHDKTRTSSSDESKKFRNCICYVYTYTKYIIYSAYVCGLLISRDTQSRCDKIKDVAPRRNIEFSRNADTTDQVCTFRDGVPQNAPRETSWEQSLLWLQV